MRKVRCALHWDSVRTILCSHRRMGTVGSRQCQDAGKPEIKTRLCTSRCLLQSCA